MLRTMLKHQGKQRNTLKLESALLSALLPPTGVDFNANFYVFIFHQVLKLEPLSEAGAPRHFSRPPGGLDCASDFVGTATSFAARNTWCTVTGRERAQVGVSVGWSVPSRKHAKRCTTNTDWHRTNT